MPSDPPQPLPYLKRLEHLERPQDQDQTLELSLQLAAEFLEFHQYSRASQLLLAALDGQPPHTQGSYLLARALAGQGKLHSATQQLARLLSAEPEHLEALLLLGQLLNRQGKPGAAQLVLRRAHAISPDDPTLHQLWRDLQLAEEPEPPAPEEAPPPPSVARPQDGGLAVGFAALGARHPFAGPQSLRTHPMSSPPQGMPIVEVEPTTEDSADIEALWGDPSVDLSHSEALPAAARTQAVALLAETQALPVHALEALLNTPPAQGLGAAAPPREPAAHEVQTSALAIGSAHPPREPAAHEAQTSARAIAQALGAPRAAPEYFSPAQRAAALSADPPASSADFAAASAIPAQTPPARAPQPRALVALRASQRPGAPAQRDLPEPHGPPMGERRTELLAVPLKPGAMPPLPSGAPPVAPQPAPAEAPPQNLWAQAAPQPAPAEAPPQNLWAQAAPQPAPAEARGPDLSDLRALATRQHNVTPPLSPARAAQAPPPPPAAQRSDPQGVHPQPPPISAPSAAPPAPPAGPPSAPPPVGPKAAPRPKPPPMPSAPPPAAQRPPAIPAPGAWRYTRAEQPSPGLRQPISVQRQPAPARPSDDGGLRSLRLMPVSTHTPTPTSPIRGKGRASEAHRRRRAQWAILGALLVIFAGGLLAGQYTLRQREAQLHSVRAQLRQSSYAGHLDATHTLDGLGAPGLYTRINVALARPLGGRDLAKLMQQSVALRARTLAERLVYFADDQLDTAEVEVAIQRAQAEAAEQPGTLIAAALLAQWRGEETGSLKLLEAHARDRAEAAEMAYAAAEIYAQRGQRRFALEWLDHAQQVDPQHPRALLLVAQLKVQAGDLLGALQDLERRIAAPPAPPEAVQIAYDRLRLALNKSPEQAQERLQTLLDQAQPLRLAPAQRAQIYEALADAHLKRGQPDLARQALLDALQVQPSAFSAKLRLAQLEYETHHIEEALRQALEGLKRWPHAPPLRNLIAQLYLEMGAPQSAVEQINALSEPDARGELLRGIALLDLREPAQARRALVAAVSQEPGLKDAQIYLALSEALLAAPGDRGALRALRVHRAGTDAPGRLEDTALPFRAYALALMHAGQWAKARDELERAVQLDERDARSQAYLCDLAAHQQQLREALVHCRRALAINPVYVPAALKMAQLAQAHQDMGALVSALEGLVNRGLPARQVLYPLARGLVGLGRFEEALRLTEGRRVKPGSELYIQGLVAAAQGQAQAAEQALSAATQQLGDEAWVHAAYGQWLMQVGSAQKAMAAYERACALEVQPSFLLSWAQAALRVGQPQLALEKAKAVQALGAEHPMSSAQRALALTLQAQALWAGPSGAAQAQTVQGLFEAALKIEPDLPVALIGLGQLAQARGQVEAAYSAYARATQVAPQSAEAWYHLGALTQSLGQAQAAQEALQRAHTLDPQGAWGVRAQGLLKGR